MIQVQFEIVIGKKKKSLGPESREWQPHSIHFISYLAKLKFGLEHGVGWRLAPPVL